MQSKITLLLIVCFGLLLAACGGTETNVNTTNSSNTANANMVSTGNSNLEPETKPETAATNNAPTLGPVLVEYYDALKRKDAAGVRKVMAQEFLKTTEAEMKEEKKADIVAFLTEYDKVPETKMETRNEQINGNKGTVEIKGGSYLTWAKLVLVNEGGAWKVTNEVAK